MQVAQLTDFQQQIANRIGARLIVCGDKPCINLGLYFPEPQVIGGLVEPNGVNCLYLDSGKVYIQNFNQVAFEGHAAQPILVERFSDNGNYSHSELIDTDGAILWSEEWTNPHESVMGFIAWLTTLNEPVVLSAKHTPNYIIDLMSIYAKQQKWPDVGDDYDNKIVPMYGVPLPELPPIKMSEHHMKFIGVDGTVGYHKGHPYNLMVGSMRGGGVTVMLGDDEATRVNYDTLAAFLYNWEWVPRD